LKLFNWFGAGWWAHFWDALYLARVAQIISHAQNGDEKGIKNLIYYQEIT